MNTLQRSYGNFNFTLTVLKLKNNTKATYCLLMCEKAVHSIETVVHNVRTGFFKVCLFSFLLRKLFYGMSLLAEYLVHSCRLVSPHFVSDIFNFKVM